MHESPSLPSLATNIIFFYFHTANRKGIRPDQINARFFGEYLDNMRNTMQADSGEDGNLSCASAPARPSVRFKKKLKRRPKCKSSSTNSSKLRGKLIQAKNQINTLYLRIKGLQKSLKASEKLCQKQVCCANFPFKMCEQFSPYILYAGVGHRIEEKSGAKS